MRHTHVLLIQPMLRFINTGSTIVVTVKYGKERDGCKREPEKEGGWRKKRFSDNCSS